MSERYRPSLIIDAKGTEKDAEDLLRIKQMGQPKPSPESQPAHE